MSFVNFMNEIKERVQEKLNDKAEVRIQKILKNNDTSFWGLIITEKEKNVSPTIYLESFYAAYLKGLSITAIVDKILDSYSSVPEMRDMNMDFFQDFEKVKERIAYRLVNLEKNKAHLAAVPYIPYLDLAICFFYAFGDLKYGEGSILIQNSHMETWNTNVKELFALAQKNTPRLFPMEVLQMEVVLEKLLEEADMEKVGNTQPANMHILTNQKRLQGAAVILYPEVLEKTAQMFDSGFYIIPSSVHEVIVVPFHKGMDIADMKGMIYEVNRTQLEAEEVLSDSLYAYDREEKRIIKL